MPLVVPGINNTDGGNSQTSKWMNELVGKKLGDASNETTFARTNLPQDHRVLKEGDFATADHKPDRLNIHTAGDGTVTKVTHG